MRIAGKKGFTLMELVVVMAVVSIMTVMVVSFTIMCNGWSQWGTSRYNVTESERQADAFLRQFVAAYDNAQYYFDTDDANGVLLAVSIAEPSETHSFYLSDQGAVVFDVPTAEGNAPLDHVTSMRFEVKTNAQNRQLIRCTMAYNLPNTIVKRSESVGNYTVLVATRATGAAV